MVDYEVRLYLNGNLLGDIRSFAEGLKWIRKRTKIGVDEIDFNVNDKVFNDWCVERNTDINTVLRPFALECRVLRNGVPVIGGFLATMPAYAPMGASATLALKFDGYLNLLNGVYINPIGTVTGRMGALVKRFIDLANTRSASGGKPYGFVANNIGSLAKVDHTFDNYKTVKEWICDRCDNTTGAGPFDVYFYADKRYDVKASNKFGDNITNYVINYPTILNGASAVSISADEVSGIATSIIGIGAGEVSSNKAKNTAIISKATDSEKVAKYGYYETLITDSSISKQSTLNQKIQTELYYDANPIWRPTINLVGNVIEPTPNADIKIWIGDVVTIKNDEDLTGMTNGKFKVNELAVTVSAANGETIAPVLERV